MDNFLQFSTQLRYINQHIIQQFRVPVPGIMALIHPLIQDTKLGLGVSPSTTNLPSTRYSAHLANVVDSLSSSQSYPVPTWSFGSRSATLPLSTIQVHLATESRLSNLLTSCALLHQVHNTSRLMSSCSQLHL